MTPRCPATGSGERSGSFAKSCLHLGNVEVAPILADHAESDFTFSVKQRRSRLFAMQQQLPACRPCDFAQMSHTDLVWSHHAIRGLGALRGLDLDPELYRW